MKFFWGGRKKIFFVVVSISNNKMNPTLIKYLFIGSTFIPVIVHLVVKYYYLRKKYRLQEMFTLYALVNFWTVYTCATFGQALEIPNLIPHYTTVPSDIIFYIIKEFIFSFILFPFTFEEKRKDIEVREVHNKYRSNKSNRKNRILIIILIYLCLFSITSTIFYEVQFPETSADQVKHLVIVDLKSEFTDYFLGLFYKVCVRVPIYIEIFLIIFYWNFFPVNVCIWIHPKQIKFNFNLKLFLLVHFIVIVTHLCKNVGVLQYFDLIDDHCFYESHVVNPVDVKVTFPEKKRNLIICILESFESSFAGKNMGGLYLRNTIPELTKQSLDPNNIQFSDNDKIGGFIQTSGAQWSFAGQMTLISGLTLKMSLNFKAFNPFLPHVKMITDVLKENGYDQYLLIPHSKYFMSTNSLFGTHGVKVIDEFDIKANWNIGRKERIYDYKIYEYAKSFLTNYTNNQKNKDKPFTAILATLDTHMPRGIVCKLCRNESKRQEENVNYCADRQAANFIEWFKEQPFANDTTLVLVGDHASMVYYFSSLVRKSRHRIFNLFINSVKKAENVSKNRQYHTFDIAPTILSSIGADIEGNRFWLGTDLFSGEKTLGEKYGLQRVNKYLDSYSEWYEKEILQVSTDLKLLIDDTSRFDINPHDM